MNIQAINLKSTRRRRKAEAKATVIGKIYVVGALLLLFAAVAGILNYRTWLNTNIANIDKQTTAYRKKIHDLNREIEDLRIRKESLSNWKHISRRVKILNLELRLPSPAQLQKLVINFDGIPVKENRTSVSSRKVAMRN